MSSVNPTGPAPVAVGTPRPPISADGTRSQAAINPPLPISADGRRSQAAINPPLPISADRGRSQAAINPPLPISADRGRSQTPPSAERTPPSAGRTPPSAERTRLDAARRLLVQSHGDFQALPPPLQRALLQDERWREHVRRQVDASARIDADADDETWRRGQVERDEDQRSRDLLAFDPSALDGRLPGDRLQAHRDRQSRALESIQADGAPGALDRVAHRVAEREREQAVLARPVPTAVRDRLAARHARDDASIERSGLTAAGHEAVLKDVLTLGACGARTPEEAALQLATLGTYGPARDAAVHLGRGSALGEQAALLSGADADLMGSRAADLLQQGSLETAFTLLNVGGLNAAARGAVLPAFRLKPPPPIVPGHRPPSTPPVSGPGVLRTAVDGGPPWTQTGPRSFHRSHREGADTWVERWDDGNRWRHRDLLEQKWDAMQRGQHGMEIDGWRCQVYGDATGDELRVLHEALQAAPPAARPLAREIYLGERLGEGISWEGPVLGLGGDGSVILHRGLLREPPRGRDVLYHEMGHNLDFAHGRPLSSSGPWGRGPSVSAYARVSAFEDFAETHRVVLGDWSRLTRQPRLAWLSEPLAEKKKAMLETYRYEERPGALGEVLWPLLAALAGAARTE